MLMQVVYLAYVQLYRSERVRNALKKRLWLGLPSTKGTLSAHKNTPLDQRLPTEQKKRPSLKPKLSITPQMSLEKIEPPTLPTRKSEHLVLGGEWYRMTEADA